MHFDGGGQSFGTQDSTYRGGFVALSVRTDSGAIASDLSVPQGCSLFGVIRNGVPSPLRADTVLAEGDKVIAIGRPDCEAELRGQLIGEQVEA